MSEKMVTVELPASIFRKLQRAAELTYRPLGELLTSTLNAVLVAPSGLPADLADELAAMHVLSDDALWSATRPSLAAAEQHRLQHLNHAAGERPLTQAEEAEQTALIHAYQRSLLRRAQAPAILAQRGYQISAGSFAPGDANDQPQNPANSA